MLASPEPWNNSSRWQAGRLNMVQSPGVVTALSNWHRVCSFKWCVLLFIPTITVICESTGLMELCRPVYLLFWASLPPLSWLQTFLSLLQKTEVRLSPWIPLTSFLLGQAAGSFAAHITASAFVLSHFLEWHFLRKITCEGFSQTASPDPGQSLFRAYVWFSFW